VEASFELSPEGSNSFGGLVGARPELSDLRDGDIKMSID
jgi:hypothetical protein